VNRLEDVGDDPEARCNSSVGLPFEVASDGCTIAVDEREGRCASLGSAGNDPVVHGLDRLGAETSLAFSPRRWRKTARPGQLSGFASAL
jgi:hypothetical protein